METVLTSQGGSRDVKSSPSTAIICDRQEPVLLNTQT